MNKTWKAYCPLIQGVCVNGFVKGKMPESESGERTTCAFFVILKGRDPQTEKVYDDPGCSFHWQPLLTIETNQLIRHTRASTDKVATEVSRKQGPIIIPLDEKVHKQLIEDQAKKRMIESKVNGSDK